MKKLYIITFFIINILLYLTGVFIEAQFNIVNWANATRTTIAVFMAIFSFVYILIVSNIIENHLGNKK